MALQGSGQITFAEIVAEFGGSGSHSLSEYYPLVGQGVSGLPSSGEFSFSQFYGKDKDVYVTNWVSSGYNQTYTQQLSSIHNGQYYSVSFMGNNNYQRYIVVGGSIHFGANAWNQGGITYNGGGGRSAPLARSQQATQWIDTSSNVTTHNVAGISG